MHPGYVTLTIYQGATFDQKITLKEADDKFKNGLVKANYNTIGIAIIGNYKEASRRNSGELLFKLRAIPW